MICCNDTNVGALLVKGMAGAQESTRLDYRLLIKNCYRFQVIHCLNVFPCGIATQLVHISNDTKIYSHVRQEVVKILHNKYRPGDIGNVLAEFIGASRVWLENSEMGFEKIDTYQTAIIREGNAAMGKRRATYKAGAKSQPQRKGQ